MPKRFLFQTHWLIGITAGTMLTVVGLTGGILSFEDAIQGGLNRDVRLVASTPEPPLSPSALITALHKQHPDKRVIDPRLSSKAGHSVRLVFGTADSISTAPPGGRGARGDIRYPARQPTPTPSTNGPGTQYR